MDSSDPLAPSPPPLNSNTFTKMKESTNQVTVFKASNMQRLLQVVQRMTVKGCRKTCQMFCCPLDTQLHEKATCCPDQTHHPAEAKSAQVAVAVQSPPSTIFIVNINNSTLIDCVIGDTYPSAVAESQHLMQGPELHMHSDQTRCSYGCGQQEAGQASPPPSQDPPSINIHGSHLKCVIIGDNNYMHAEQSY